MRLKKAEREEYLNTVKDYKGQKVIPIEKDDDVDYALFMLSKDHFSKLTSDLRHIGKISSTDLIEDYVHEYSDEEFDLLLLRIDEADKGMLYLKTILRDECYRRAKEKERLANRLKSKMQKEQTKRPKEQTERRNT